MFLEEKKCCFFLPVIDSNNILPSEELDVWKWNINPKIHRRKTNNNFEKMSRLFMNNDGQM